MPRKKNTELRRIDQPLYTYRQALVRAFYSPSLYVDVGLRWKGFGFLYLLLVAMVFSIPLTVRVMLEFKESYQTQIVEPMQELPLLVVQNGQLQFDKPMPYFLKNKEGKINIIIDTTGQIKKFDKNYPDLAILINQDQIAFKQPKPDVLGTLTSTTEKNPITIQTFNKETNEVFNGKEWVASNQVNVLYYVMMALIYPVIFLVFYGIYLTFLPMIALMGQAFSRIFFSYPIKYKDSNRLIMVAATPMLLVGMLVLATKVKITGIGLILMILLSLYYSFGVAVIKRQMTKVARR